MCSSFQLQGKLQFVTLIGRYDLLYMMVAFKMLDLMCYLAPTNHGHVEVKWLI